MSNNPSDNANRSLDFDPVELLATALDQQQIGMCLYDANEQVRGWNNTYLRIFPEEADILAPGLAYQETLRRYYELNLPSHELSLIEQHVAEGLKRYRQQREPFIFQRKDGRWIKNEVQHLRDGSRLHTWRDVTEEGPNATVWPDLKDAFASIDVAYALFDADGGFVAANKRYSQRFPECVDLNLSGTAYHEHLRRHAAHALAADEYERIETLATRQISQATLIKNAMTFRTRKQGWLQLEERPTKSGGLISFWHDVSERVEAQTQVETLQDRLRDAVESLADGFALFDSDDRLVICNSRYQEYGATQATPGTPWIDLVRAGAESGFYPEAQGRVEQWIAERAAHHRRADGEVFEIRLSGGTWLRVTDLRTRDGGTVGIRTDITALKLVEQRFRTIAESIPVIINAAYGDDAGCVLYASPPAAKLFGLSLEKIHGLSALDLVSDREQLRTLYHRAEKSHDLQEIEATMRRADGSTFIAALTSKRIDYDGREAYVSTLVDLSERKIAEEMRLAKEAADEANRAKSQFLAHMSHELRTPLNAILGYAQLLRRSTELDEKQRDSLNVIHTAGEHLLGLINDILDLTKIESQKLEVNNVLFNLNQFLIGIERIFHFKANEKNIEFRQDISPDLPTLVRGDEQKLRQVIFNLIGNAIKFTDTGEVIFSATAQDGKICFSVSDTGHGIRETDLDLVFQPFQQALGSGRMNEGTGLGLTISRTMVELLGGTLNVESEFGVGSRFWFTIPLPASSSSALDLDANPEPKIKGYSGPRRRILVVDDDAENRSLLVDMLLTLDFELEQAGDGSVAIAKAASFKPHAILMDLRMPIMDGITAIRHLRQLAARDLIIIGISASAFVRDRRHCLEAGADAFLAKPYRQQTLLALLRQHLDLDLIYENEGASMTPAPAPAALLYPDTATLDMFKELALQGDIKTLLEQAQQLEQDDQRYHDFATELRTLAKGFQIRKINQLLDSAQRG